ncbi:MAG: alpha/beta hydrolase [Acidimicrobiales bacterium]
MIWQRETLPDSAGRVLHVALPEGYHQPGNNSRYPLLVCLDAQWTFGTVCDSALNLGLARLLPRVIVVGVGWSSDVAREITRLRAQALTPTQAVVPPFVVRGEQEAVRGGGGPDYRRWLLGEALPLIDARYRTLSGERTLIGHSLSALFGLGTLLEQPGAFNRYLLASPSIWWDDRVILAHEDHSREQGVTLEGQVFLSVGGLEEGLGGQPMITNARLMHERLAARAGDGLDTTLVVLEDELHHSTIPAAISRGLRWLYR